MIRGMIVGYDRIIEGVIVGYDWMIEGMLVCRKRR